MCELSKHTHSGTIQGHRDGATHNHTYPYSYSYSYSSYSESGPGSWWGPYIDTLPLSRGNGEERGGEEDGAWGEESSALDWADSELALSPTLMQHVAQMREHRASAQAAVEGGLGLGQLDGCGGEGWRGDKPFAAAFNEAYALVMSRKAAALIVDDNNGVGNGKGEDHGEAGAGTIQDVLTPLLDLLNHARAGGQYTQLQASEGVALGMALLAPEGGLRANSEVWHDYEVGWSKEAMGEGEDDGDERACAHELLAAYGFVLGPGSANEEAEVVVEEETDGGGSASDACVLLPWVGVVKMGDAMGTRGAGQVLEWCTGATPVQSSSGAMLAEALRWEIERSLEEVETILEEEGRGERDACGGTATGAGECASNELTAQHRAEMVLHVTRGEAAELRALKAACSASEGAGSAHVGTKTEKKKMKKKKKRRKREL